eukprot:maker-scaffold1702_size30647-snap-gene-0.16 protein:Tk01988 transcript:maker-scaffold1702_size30647-snap-gene-0.16-mRNA-1 annotation:"hypothetical protein CAPTEDRAFT_137298"
MSPMLNQPEMGPETSTADGRILSEDEKAALAQQDSRMVSEFRAQRFHQEARKHWDLFYKRNATRFFKDRHWTTREFRDLCADSPGPASSRHMLEVGCGVGNLVFPLLAEQTPLFIYACDFSQRAVDLVRADSRYDEARIRAFHCDITRSIVEQMPANDHGGRVHVVSMVFVLSAIQPDDFARTLANVFQSLRPGGVFLFRDYAVNDMAMIRFGAGHKIADCLYLRQDGTTSSPISPMSDERP